MTRAVASIDVITRFPPLDVSCAVGVGDVAGRLVERLLALDDTSLGGLRGVASANVVVILGAADVLPWVDGIQYLGVDPAAPSLLLSTHRRPAVPLDAFERATLARIDARPPIAVIFDPPKLVSLASARPIDRIRLESWLAARPLSIEERSR